MKQSDAGPTILSSRNWPVTQRKREERRVNWSTCSQLTDVCDGCTDEASGLFIIRKSCTPLKRVNNGAGRHGTPWNRLWNFRTAFTFAQLARQHWWIGARILRSSLRVSGSVNWLRVALKLICLLQALKWRNNLIVVYSFNYLKIGTRLPTTWSRLSPSVWIVDVQTVIYLVVPKWLFSEA